MKINTFTMIKMFIVCFILAIPINAMVVTQEDFDGLTTQTLTETWQINADPQAGAVKIDSVGGKSSALIIDDISNQHQIICSKAISPLEDDFAVEYDVMLTEATNQATGALYINRTVCLAFIGDNFRVFDDSQAKDVMPYEPGKWHHIMYFINMKEKTFSLYIDDLLRLENIRFREQRDKLTSIRFETGGSHNKGKLCIDNIVLRELNDSEKISLQAASEKLTKARKDLQKKYKWFDAKKLVVDENYNPDAWYRKPMAENISYDLDLGFDAAAKPVAIKYGILLSKDCDEVEKFAARQLQKYIAKSTGQFIPLLAPQDLAGKVVIQIGSKLENSFSDSVGEDDYVIKSAEGKLILSGATSRATLYSVYHFLEKYMGCRWYFPDPEEEIVPKKDIAVIKKIASKSIDEYFSPAMKYRDLMVLNTDALVENDRMNPGWKPFGTQIAVEDQKTWLKNELVRTVYKIDWMAKNRFNTITLEGAYAGMRIFPKHWDLMRTMFPEIKKRGLHLGVSGHFWTPFLNNQTPGWPEDNSWGNFSGGRFHPVTLSSRICFCTTNYDAVKAFLSNMISFFRANPEFDLWAIWPPDASPCCNCPVCSLFADSTLNMVIHNQMADALEAESKKRNQKIKMIMLCYAHLNQPPSEQIKLHPDISVMPDIYRVFQGPYRVGSANAWKKYIKDNGENNELLLFGRFTRTYLTGYHLLPPSSMSQTMKNLIADGYSGVQLFHGCGGWWIKGLWQYQAAKMMWDSNACSAELNREFFDNYYGPAAQSMCNFYLGNENAHLTSKRVFHYAANHDAFAPWQMHRSPPVNPDYDGKYESGLMGFSRTMVGFDDDAQGFFKQAESLAQASGDPELLKKRIAKAKLSWDYYVNQKFNIIYQFKGLRALEKAYGNSATTGEYLKNVAKAQKQFQLADQSYKRYVDYSQKYTALHNECSADEGVFWDGGYTLKNRCDRWLEIVDQLKANAKDKQWGDFPNQRLWKVKISSD